MGRRHAENVARSYPRALLVAVADANAAAAESTAAALSCEWYVDPLDLLERPDVQAVVIVTSDDTHAALVQAAAERGKSILCEKPLALTVKDARTAVAAAERAGVLLQIGFMRRYDPAYREAYEAIEQGDIGQPVLFTAISRDAEPPPRSYFTRPGAGGVFINSAIHDFDLARWMMRDEVASVSATGAVVACHDLADVQPIDLGLATLTYRNGAVGTVQVFRRAVYGYDIRTEVVGTEATVVVGDHRRYPVEILRREGITHTMANHWLDRFTEAYALEMADWIDRVREGKPPEVTGEDGIKSVEISLAAEEAHASGQAVFLQ